MVFQTFFTIFAMKNKTDQWNLVYYIGKTKQETIMWGKPYAVCKWKSNILRNSTHSMGHLKIERH